MGLGNRAARVIFSGASFLSAAATLAVLGFMLLLSLPVLKSGGLWAVLTGPWSPDRGVFGIQAMIAGTFVIALLSLLISFPVSLGCAIFIEITHQDRLGQGLRHLVQLMTAVPTVIYGFVGVFLLVPLVRDLFSFGSGMSILSAALVLAWVISPTMILLFSQSFARVPRPFTQAVDALGGSPSQKFFYVILPQAWPGILTGIVLAFGRAMGDTLVALMLSGNSVMSPASLLDSARTLTAHIALTMAADFNSAEFLTIFVCGLVLYLLTGAGICLARLAEGRSR